MIASQLHQPEFFFAPKFCGGGDHRVDATSALRKTLKTSALRTTGPWNSQRPYEPEIEEGLGKAGKTQLDNGWTYRITIDRLAGICICERYN